MKVSKNVQLFISAAKKPSRHGRKRGVWVPPSKGCAQFFKRVDIRFDNFVLLEMAVGFMSHETLFMCVFCYIFHCGTLRPMLILIQRKGSK